MRWKSVLGLVVQSCSMLALSYLVANSKSIRAPSLCVVIFLADNTVCVSVCSQISASLFFDNRHALKCHIVSNNLIRLRF